MPKVLKAIKGLRDGYKVGRIILEKGKLQSQSEETGIAALAAKHGYYPEAGRKLRKFADLYSKEDLDALCELCHEHRSAFGLARLYLLLPIENRKARLDFQTAAVQGRWKHTRMLLELRRRFGREPAKRGRRPLKPVDQTDGLLQLFRMTLQFGRWHDRNFVAEEKPVHLPASVKTALDLAADAVKALHEATDKALKRTRKAQHVPR